VSDANVKSAGGISAPRSDWVALLSDYDNLYKSHTITKQQYEQTLAAKQEAESQVRVLQQQQKRLPSRNQLL
jgi:membrane fusion protein (multidrug efflux system)